MRIGQHDHTVVLSPQGGSVLQWQWGPLFILGPAAVRTIGGGSNKWRGESHWCFPHHGSAVPNEPKHGWLRGMTCDEQYHKDTTAEFEWIGRARAAASIVAEPDGTAMLKLGLAVRNLPSPLKILPAFHPYFTVDADKTGVPEVLRVGGKVVDLEPRQITNDWHAVIERADPILVTLPIGTVEMAPSSDCKWLVAWTDSDDYLCVEPIFGGYPGNSVNARLYTLAPDAKYGCSVELKFSPR